MAVKEDDFDDASGWKPRLTWTVLLVFGWLLYEATAQPGLAAAITCAKFGWADFQAARWLRRVDPDRGRGRACFWFYLAFGLWKIAVLATVMMIALLFIGSIIHAGKRPFGRGAGLSPVLGGILLSAAIGFGFSFLATYVALWSAVRHRVKIWLGSAPYRARTQRFWPPCHGQTNAAPFVTVTTLILTLWAFLLSLLLLAARAGRGNVAFLILLPGCIIVALAGFLLIFRLLDHRVFAKNPNECWATTDGEAAYEAIDGELGHESDRIVK
jgi:hypothetical protein